MHYFFFTLIVGWVLKTVCVVSPIVEYGRSIEKLGGCQQAMGGWWFLRENGTRLPPVKLMRK